MANYSGPPTILRSWEEGDRNNKIIRSVRRVSITLSSQGGATNLIPATALGFVSGYLEKANLVLFTDTTPQKRALSLFTDGTNLYTGDPTTATDASRELPTDVSGTLICELYGKTS